MKKNDGIVEVANLIDKLEDRLAALEKDIFSLYEKLAIGVIEKDADGNDCHRANQDDPKVKEMLHLLGEYLAFTDTIINMGKYFENREFVGWSKKTWDRILGFEDGHFDSLIKQTIEKMNCPTAAR